MPTYEYACRSCGHHLEVAQSFSDEPLTTCPSCGGPLRKVFGSIGIVLKGSGFYKTDSRPAPKEGKEAKTSGDGASKPDTAAASSSSGSSSKDSGSGAGSSSGSDKGGSSGSGSTSTKPAAAGSAT